MGTEGRVVVVAQPRILQHKVNDLYAAEFLELGLGATGPTPEEALRKVMGMFVGAVQSRRKVGTACRVARPQWPRMALGRGLSEVSL